MGSSKIELLEANVRKLISILVESQNDLLKLEQEKEELKKKLRELSDNKVVSKESMTNENVKAQTLKNQEMRKQLDLFVDELDACISMVEKM